MYSHIVQLLTYSHIVQLLTYSHIVQLLTLTLFTFSCPVRHPTVHICYVCNIIKLCLFLLSTYNQYICVKSVKDGVGWWLIGRSPDYILRQRSSRFKLGISRSDSSHGVQNFDSDIEQIWETMRQMDNFLILRLNLFLLRVWIFYLRYLYCINIFE